MALQLRNENIYNDLVEPIIIIDTQTKKVDYCNSVCINLKICESDMDISDFTNVLVNVDTYEQIRNFTRTSEQERIIENVLLHTLGEGIIRGDLRAMYIDSSRRYLYLMFRYNHNDMSGVFLRSRCFQSIYTLSYSYPFHLDVKNKIISFIGTVMEDFNVTQTISNYPEAILEQGVIHADDIDIFRHVVEKMYQGEITQEMFRAYRTDGEPLWYQVRCVANRDQDRNPIEVLGEFVNVQNQQELEFKSRTDELTGCLNKTAFQDTVANLLNKSTAQDKYALFIVDMDNFKIINDNLGHPFGDSVLREAGQQLNAIFTKPNLIGRIGGDEFMVLMRLTDDVTELEYQVLRVMDAFHNTYKGSANIYRTTASIGIALYPKDGQDFQTLYEHADIALYSTKCNGKNGYTFYTHEMQKINLNNSTPFDSASHALSQQFDQRTIAEVFTLLTEAKDYSASINKVLALLGTRFNVSRCYVFEYRNENDGYFQNTFEWCTKGISSEIAYLQNVSLDVFQPFFDLTNVDGIFYCNNLDIFKGKPTFDVMNNQGIKSFLFSFNKDGDKITSMIGFDDCITERTWSPIEIFTLMHASKIINQFIKYVIAVKQISKVAEERLLLLEESHSYSYLIDEETCEILYFNQDLIQTFPNVKKGDPCYSVLENKPYQCEGCPVLRMKQQNKDKYRCIKTNEQLNKPMLVNITRIGLFKGKNCMFFSCSSLEDMDE